MDPNVVGHIDLTLEVLARDKHVNPDISTSAISWETAHNEVVWEPRYYADREACSRRWRDLQDRYVRHGEIAILLTLPDPPEEFEFVRRYLASVLGAVEAVSEQAPEVADVSVRALSAGLGLTPGGLRAIVDQFQQGVG